MCWFKLFLKVSLAVSLNSHSLSFAQETVHFQEVVETWKTNRVEEIVVKFSGEHREWRGNTTDDFASEPLTLTKPTTRPVIGEFRRNVHSGIWLEIDGTIDNQIGDVCQTLFQSVKDMGDLQQLIVNRCSDRNSAGSNLLTVHCLYWLDPLATKLFTSAAKIQHKEMRLDNHELHGPATRLVFTRDGKKTSTTLVKKFGWRPIIIEEDVKGKPRSRLQLSYQTDSSGICLLIEVEHTNFDEQGVSSQQKLVFKDHRLKCQATDLEIVRPSHCLVTDKSSGNEEQYIIRKDGSIRRFSTQEHRRAGEIGASWNDIINSEEGELFGQSKNGWRTSHNWFVAVGVLLAIAGIYLYRQSRSNSD